MRSELIFTLALLCVSWQVSGRTLSSQSSEDSQELDEDEEACITELNLDREKIIRLNEEQIAPEDDPDYNQFMECYGKRVGFITSNGEVDYQEIKQAVLDMVEDDPGLSYSVYKNSKKIITTAVRKCRRNAPEGSSEGQTLVKALNCIVKQIMEVGDDLI